MWNISVSERLSSSARSLILMKISSLSLFISIGFSINISLIFLESPNLNLLFNSFAKSSNSFGKIFLSFCILFIALW